MIIMTKKTRAKVKATYKII